MTKKKKRSVPQVLVFLWIGISIAITWSTSKMLYLKYYGKEASGIVQSVYIVGSKGKMTCNYTFYVNGASLKGDVMFNLLKRGDSITVLYSTSYPEINVPKKFIEEYY